MNQIKRIPVEKLEVGMYVSNETHHLAENELRTEGFIRREDTLEKLKQRGIKDIHIDVNKGLDSPFATPVHNPQKPPQPKVPLKKEMAKAQKVYDEARRLVGGILTDVKLGKPIDVAPMEALADDINNSILNNSNALLCLSVIREKDQYLMEHSINVAILMGIFTRFLGFEPDAVHQLVTGALLHDIGKIHVPSNILNKNGKLSPEEWIEMKRHVVYGQKVLQESRGISDIAKAICGQHHERLDGNGYPVGLQENDISVYGRLAAVVDIYDAATADRVYQKGRPPSEAMKLLLEISGNHLDKSLVYDFIRCMGVYPVGTAVELSNGRIGVVISSHPNKPNQPKVRTFYNSRHRHYETVSDIDLSSPLVDIEIFAAVDPSLLNIDIKEFI